jgi:hypothetical protein
MWRSAIHSRPGRSLDVAAKRIEEEKVPDTEAVSGALVKVALFATLGPQRSSMKALAEGASCPH